MTTVFGKAFRGRRKPDDGEVTQIADEANLWWTRRDFVQHAVVRTKRPTGTSQPAEPRPAADVAPDDPTLDGRSFSEVFTTASLFDGDARARPRPTPDATPDPTAAHHDGRTEAPATEAAPRAATAAGSRPRHRTPMNHPLTPALVALGLDGDATWADVQHAYRAKAKEAHPDHSGDDGEAMAEINVSYTALRDGRRYGLFGDD